MKNNILTALSLTLLIFGSGLLINLIRSTEISITSTPPSTPVYRLENTKLVSSLSGQPNELIIPSLNIDLPIIPGYYNSSTKTWTLTLNKVQYAVITPPPNNIAGDTFIYGHYRKDVFAKLHTISPNAQAIVKTNNYHEFKYSLSSVKTTKPTDDSVFRYYGKPILTIQTCSGLFFQNRQLYNFSLTEAS